MRTIKQLFMMAVMAVMLSSCVTHWFTSLSQKSQSIEPGMTKQEVMNILGTCKYRSFRDNYELWEYRSPLGSNDWDVVRIEFVEGRVINLDSFREIYHDFPEKQKNPS
jgi:hypothetical protein